MDGSSGFLATSTFLGAVIIARMAAASASALRRRSRSAWRVRRPRRPCGRLDDAQHAASAASAGLAPRRGSAARRGAAAGFGRLAAGDGARPRRRRPWLRLGAPSRRRRAAARLGARAGAFLLLALAALLGQFFFLAADQLGLAARFFLAAGAVRRRRRSAAGGAASALDRRRDLVALDEGALLAHLDLDRARLAGGVGLLDLAGRLVRQRDLLALGARRCRGWRRKPSSCSLSASVSASSATAWPRRPTAAARAASSAGRLEFGGELGDGGTDMCGSSLRASMAVRVGGRLRR